MPIGSTSYREMPEVAWQMVREILAHEKPKNPQTVVVDMVLFGTILEPSKQTK